MGRLVNKRKIKRMKNITMIGFPPLQTPQNPPPQHLSSPIIQPSLPTLVPIPSSSSLPPFPPCYQWTSYEQQKFENFPLLPSCFNENDPNNQWLESPQAPVFPSYGASHDTMYANSAMVNELITMQEIHHENHYRDLHYRYDSSVLMQEQVTTSSLLNPQLVTTLQPARMWQQAPTMSSQEEATMPSLSMPQPQPQQPTTVLRHPVMESEAVESTKGKQWTQDEHKLFLIGLDEYGKGDWKSISRNVVKTRTPAQVASHAQKFFKRTNGSTGGQKRKRGSMHDMKVDNGSVDDLIDRGLLDKAFRRAPETRPPSSAKYKPWHCTHEMQAPAPAADPAFQDSNGSELMQ